MKSLRTTDLDALLLASPKGNPIKPQTSQINEMTINTIIDPRFRAPVKIHNRVWFNPADASALGRIRLRRGEDDFKKIYRFTEQGVFRHRIEPKNKKEASLEPENWTDIKDSFYPYDLTRLGCAIVTDRSLLLYVLVASEIAAINNSAPLCVFGKRQLHRVQFQASGLKPLDVSFLQITPQTEIRTKKQIQALKIALTSKPIQSNLDEYEAFSFFGLHQDISVYIDSANGFPVRISGIIPTIGEVELKLNEVHLSLASD